VDIASNALKKIPAHPNIHTIQDFVPDTQLKDYSYDLVIAADLILKLPKNLYRLFFSELARLSKPLGHIYCSTPLDFKTDDPLAAFLALAETELEVIDYEVRYDRIWLSVLNLLDKLPTLRNWWAESERCLKYAGKLTKFIYNQNGISHVALIAKKRSLFEPLKKDELPIERPGKKAVWE